MVWSAIHGAKIANKILRSLSSHLAPDKFWISWPYGYYPPSAIREHRKNIINNHIMLSCEDKTVRDGLYLGLTLTTAQISQLVKESKTRSSGMWKDPGDRTERYTLEERFSYKNFNLKQVFETLDQSIYSIEKIENYYGLDNWQCYCHFLSENKDIKKPKALCNTEWNEIGYDSEE